MIMKYFVLLFFYLYSLIKLTGQSYVDVVFIFKLSIFLDKINNEKSNGTYYRKDTALFNAFNNKTNLKIDTLTTEGFESTSLQFYRLHLDSIDVSDIANDEEQNILLFSGMNSILILSIDLNTGQTYRLRGFNNNDFSSFLADLNQKDKAFKAIKNKKKYFLKTYNVPGIDFPCLFKAFNYKKMEREKYKCLCKYSTPISVY